MKRSDVLDPRPCVRADRLRAADAFGARGPGRQVEAVREGRPPARGHRPAPVSRAARPRSGRDPRHHARARHDGEDHADGALRAGPRPVPAALDGAGRARRRTDGPDLASFACASGSASRIGGACTTRPTSSSRWRPSTGSPRAPTRRGRGRSGSTSGRSAPSRPQRVARAHAAPARARRHPRPSRVPAHRQRRTLMTTYRITIDPSLCSGFGSCVELAPEAFELGPDGIATPSVTRPTTRMWSKPRRTCPMGAITVEPSRRRRHDSRGRVLIVGAGLAGARCARRSRQRLRRRAPARRAPRTPPYERPALSKEHLAGSREPRRSSCGRGRSGTSARSSCRSAGASSASIPSAHGLDRPAARSSSGTRSCSPRAPPHGCSPAGAAPACMRCERSPMRPPCATSCSRARAWRSSAPASSAQRWPPPPLARRVGDARRSGAGTARARARRRGRLAAGRALRRGRSRAAPRHSRRTQRARRRRGRRGGRSRARDRCSRRVQRGPDRRLRPNCDPGHLRRGRRRRGLASAARPAAARRALDERRRPGCSGRVRNPRRGAPRTLRCRTSGRTSSAFGSSTSATPSRGRPWSSRASPARSSRATGTSTA